MVVLKKKQAVLIVLAVLIAAMGYINWSFNNGEQIEEVSTNKPLASIQLVESNMDSDLFAEIRLDREVSRAESVETLKSMSENEGLESVAKENAQNQMISLAMLTEKEVAAEGLIKAKGYEDAIVYVSDNTAEVIVKAESLSADDVSIISDIVQSKTGISQADIKIMNVK